MGQLTRTYIQRMPPLIYSRIFGYIVTITMHVVNAIVMLSALKPEVLERDHENRIMASMLPYYLTVWNVVLQTVYATLGLYCDSMTLLKKQELNGITRTLKLFRHTFFETLVFPVTFLIFLLFWPIFIYDRNLLFPDFIDRVFSRESNFVIHLCIVPVAIWELMFQPKRPPKSHTSNIIIVLMYYTIYNLVLLCHYQYRGLWPYPLFTFTYGTISFVFLLSFVLILSLTSYFIQWQITAFIWNENKLICKVE